MITVALAGQEKSVVSGNLTMPRVGVWLADLVVNDEHIATGAATVTLAGVDMPGHIQRCELVKGMLHVRIIGGAGRLGEPAKPQHYRNPTVRQVVADLATGAGETLSTTCTPDVLRMPLGYWTTLSTSTGALLQALADTVGNGCAWRILFDGSLWFGKETWPMCPADVRIMDHDAHNASQVLGSDVLGIWPGTTIESRRIDLVYHSFPSCRSTVYFAESHT